ncbi:MAG TPA: hypothetical protein VGD99_07440, partial [Anaerolineae bacterium]
RAPEVVLCFPAITYINGSGKIKRMAHGDVSIRAGSPAERLYCFVNHQMASEDIFWAVFGLIRSETLRKTGLLGKYIAADQVLLLKLLLQGQFYQLPEHLYFRRIHPLASTVKLPQSPTYRERVQWYDAKSTARIVLPNWRLMMESLSAIKTDHAQARCYCPIVKMFTLRWKRLARELISIPSQILDEKSIVRTSIARMILEVWPKSLELGSGPG